MIGWFGHKFEWPRAILFCMLSRIMEIDYYFVVFTFSNCVHVYTIYVYFVYFYAKRVSFIFLGLGQPVCSSASSISVNML